MINKIKNMMFVALAVSMVACQPEEPEASTITSIPFSLESISVEDISVSERSRIIPISFTLDEGQIVETTVDIAVASTTTATEGEDFVLSTHSVTVPAYVREGMFTVEILEDLEADGDESVDLVLTGAKPFGIRNEQEVSITIVDSIYTTLIMDFAWDGEFDFMGSTFGICGNVDLDFLVLDEAGDLVSLFGAATGACPEQLVFDESVADGSYTIIQNFYENGLDSLFLNVPYPVTVDVTKGGAFSETFATDLFFTSEDMDFVNDGADSNLEVMTVVKNGNMYEISLPDGSVIAQGIFSRNSLFDYK